MDHRELIDNWARMDEAQGIGGICWKNRNDPCPKCKANAVRTSADQATGFTVDYCRKCHWSVAYLIALA